MKKILLLVSAIFISLILFSCGEDHIEHLTVIYNGNEYVEIENWEPINEEFTSVSVTIKVGKKAQKQQTGYLYKDCSQAFLEMRLNGEKRLFHQSSDNLPSHKNISKVSEIRVVSPQEEKVVDSALYVELLNHIAENKENSYITSNSPTAKVVYVTYKDYGARQKIGHIIYDDDGKLCFCDITLPQPEEVSWAYPLPFDITK